MDYFHENYYDANKKQLNLSQRNLRSLNETIIATFAHCTEYLDLSHNRINNLNWIYEFPLLKCLILDDNRLREPHFENLTHPIENIHTLMLNRNELSDLRKTADILQRIFPNVRYLSLHGNALCPDNLLLQPFCEFVPYEYNHYRTVLVNSLPYLRFLDHFSLDYQTIEPHINNPTKHFNHQERQQKHLVTEASNSLCSKVKSFLIINTSPITTKFSKLQKYNSVLQHEIVFGFEIYAFTHDILILIQKVLKGIAYLYGPFHQTLL